MKSALLQALPDGRAAYVEVRAPAGLSGSCFIWQGATSKKGYALRGKGLLHRAVYEEAHGPLGRLQVHHVCRRPSCVNVAHLEAHTARTHKREHLPRPAMIDEAVALLEGFPMLSPGSIARLTGRNRDSLYIALRRAVADGLIVRVEHGEYALADSNQSERRTT